MHSQHFANSFSAGNAAVLHQRENEWAWAAAVHTEEQPSHSAEPPSVVSPPPSPTAAAAPSSPWTCIATAETGDVPAPGPIYWTVFGVVTDIIHDYGSPEEQAQIFDGTASYQTQLDVVSRFAADHGFGGWGELTKQKCGL